MPLYCTYCHDGSCSHNANDCPEKSSRTKRTKSAPTKPTCWNCSSTTHVKKDCPTLKPRKISSPNNTSPAATPDLAYITPETDVSHDQVDPSRLTPSNDNDTPMLDATKDCNNTSMESTNDDELLSPEATPMDTIDSTTSTPPITNPRIVTEDQIMDNTTGNTTTFIHHDAESIGRQYNADNKYKDSKVVTTNYG